MTPSLKKVLDTVEERWYNLVRGFVERPLKMEFDKDSIKQFISSNTFNEERSLRVMENIVSLGNTLKDIPSYEAIIAGGSLRDMVLGSSEPKDYDVFINIPDDDEADDNVLLFASDLLEKNDDANRLKVTAFEGFEDYNGNMNVPEDSQPTLRAIYNIGQVVNEDDLIVDETTVQVIGHTNPLIDSDPLAFVETFDYNLVRAYYDPRKEVFVFHRDFLDGLKTKTIACNSERTAGRVANWKYRCWIKDFPWKIETTWAKKEKKPLTLINPCSEIILGNNDAFRILD